MAHGNGETRPRSDDWPLDSAVLIDVASDFGELTPASLRRLAEDRSDSPVRIASRRERIERIGGKQALRLFEAMYGLLPPELQDVDSVRAILARSYGVGIGFALLPNRERAPTSLNEETALDDICQNPSSWLQFSDEIEAERFTFTDDGQGLLRAAYQPEGGCPLIGLEVTGPEPNSTDTLNVFVMYWGMLASEYEPRPTAS